MCDKHTAEDNDGLTRREFGVGMGAAGLAALRAAAQKHAIDREHAPEASPEHAPALEAGSIRERLARILDRGSHRNKAEVVQETEPQHGQDDIRARLRRILGREVEQTEAEAGSSSPGQEARSIRDRLQNVLAREKQVTREEHGQEQEERVHRRRDRGHELEN